LTQLNLLPGSAPFQTIEPLEQPFAHFLQHTALSERLGSAWFVRWIRSWNCTVPDFGAEMMAKIAKTTTDKTMPSLHRR